MERNKKLSELKMWVSLIGLTMTFVGGLFNLIGTSIAGGVLIFSIILDDKEEKNEN